MLKASCSSWHGWLFHFVKWRGGWRGNKKVTQKMKDMKRSTQKTKTKKRTKLLSSQESSRNWISHGKSYQQNDTDPLPPHQRSDVDVAPILVLQSSTKGILGTRFSVSLGIFFLLRIPFIACKMVNQLFSSTLQKKDSWSRPNLQENIGFVFSTKKKCFLPSFWLWWSMSKTTKVLPKWWVLQQAGRHEFSFWIYTNWSKRHGLRHQKTAVSNAEPTPPLGALLRTKQGACLSG